MVEPSDCNHLHTHTHTHTHTLILKCKHMLLYTCALTHECTRTHSSNWVYYLKDIYVHAEINLNTHRRSHTQTHTHTVIHSPSYACMLTSSARVNKRECARVCMCACVCACTPARAWPAVPPSPEGGGADEAFQGSGGSGARPALTVHGSSLYSRSEMQSSDAQF